MNEPFPYSGPEALRRPIVDALSRVVDPEIALSIVDVGLVYGVRVEDDMLHVQLTMTSAACPATDLIVEAAEAELACVEGCPPRVEIELVWEPPWTIERMSEHAWRFLHC